MPTAIIKDLQCQPYHNFAEITKTADDSNYTESFGFQWNKFEKTQIDRFHAANSQSSERFWKETGWNAEALKGKNILEVGSGAGRFTNIMLNETEATIYSVDYSSAVEANYRNNGPNSRLFVVQASIYEMPFLPHQFDYVFCLGVLQHTPDFERSVAALADMVKPGGELAVDFYEKRSWLTKIHAKYIFRPFTKSISKEKLLSVIENNAGWLIKLYKILGSLGLHVLTRFLPICDIKNTLPKQLTKEELKEWVILDTFDMLSPAYDDPQSIATVSKWVANSGLDVTFAGHVLLVSGKAAVVRAGRKP
jgi:2-polyprenyl-3-methyl-5-hydroxy-6-metoxy-1,4-benzoquinol methylase